MTDRAYEVVRCALCESRGTEVVKDPSGELACLRCGSRHVQPPPNDPGFEGAAGAPKKARK